MHTLEKKKKERRGETQKEIQGERTEDKRREGKRREEKRRAEQNRREKKEDRSWQEDESNLYGEAANRA